MHERQEKRTRASHTHTQERTNERTNERSFFICTKKKRAHFPRPFGYSLYCLRNASYLDNPLRVNFTTTLFPRMDFKKSAGVFELVVVVDSDGGGGGGGRVVEKESEEYKNNNKK